MIFYMGSSFYTFLNGDVTSNKGGNMFKQMFCELIEAFVNCLIMLLVCIFMMIYTIVILIGNVLAVFGFDGFINKALGRMYGPFSDVYGEDSADTITDWFRVVK